MKKTILLFSALISANVYADTYQDAANAAVAKRWTEARDLAAKATQENPNDARAWYLLGVIEQRLTNPGDAAQAFRKTASLAPDSTYGKAASEGAPPLELRADADKMREFGKDSNAFFLEYSPSLGTSAASQLSATTPWGVSAGFKFGMVLVGFLYGHSSGVNSILAPAEGSALNTSTSAGYSRINGSGSLLRREIFVEPEISLVKPYGSWGPFALDLPLLFGGVENTVSLNSTNYGNIGYDMAAGLRLSLYSKSTFVIAASALYHVGIPFWDIRHDSNTLGIENTQGSVISGSTTGFELNLGVRFLFGSDVRDEI